MKELMRTDSSDVTRPLSSQFFCIIVGHGSPPKPHFTNQTAFTFHRCQLRSLLGLKWSDKVSNTDLQQYRRTNSQPLSMYFIYRALHKSTMFSLEHHKYFVRLDISGKQEGIRKFITKMTLLDLKQQLLPSSSHVYLEKSLM